MTRYAKLQQQITATGMPVYSPYVMLGYPEVETSFEVCRTLIGEKVHSLELGLPFRDPVADGPVIEAAGNVALDNGMSVDKAVALVRRIRAIAPETPLTLMGYYNMVLARTPERFIGDFAEAGIDALLVPDLPPESAHELAPLARKHGIDLVFIVSPLSDDHRLVRIAEAIGGFTYVLTRLGVTGANSSYAGTLTDLFARIHSHIPLPAFAGFGISEPEHAAQMVAAGADGVIVGTRIVQLIQESLASGQKDFAPLVAHTRGILAALATKSLAK